MRKIVACGSAVIAVNLARQFCRDREMARLNRATMDVNLGGDVFHFADASDMNLVRRFRGYEFNAIEFQGDVPEDVQCFLRSLVRPLGVAAAPTASSNGTTPRVSTAEKAGSQPPVDASDSSTSPAQTSARETARARALDGWLVLRELLGYVEDGSGKTVTISQDDATKTWCVAVGRRTFYHEDSLYLALCKARHG